MKINSFTPVSPKLFEGEKRLVYTALFGFLLAAVCGVYAILHGPVVLPEGNVQDAFSFNAAVGIFILSVAAFMPLAGFEDKKRLRLRSAFIWTTLLGYGIETVQHFRGINPRFTQSSSIIDAIANGIFGLVCLMFIIITVIFAAAFFKKNRSDQRPLLSLAIRHAFISIVLSFAAGAVMILLQNRFLGPAGNFIILHGIGFHALQSLPIIAWLLEKSQTNRLTRRNIKLTPKGLIHAGSIAWTAAVIWIALQTLLGKTVFEWSLLPLLTFASLFLWGAALAASCFMFYRSNWSNPHDRLISKIS